MSAEQLDRIESLLISFIEQTTGKFDQIDSRFDKVDSKFDQMDAKFDKVDAKFDQMDAKFDQVDARFDQVDARLDGVDARLDAVQSQLDRMEQAQHDDIIAVLQITNAKLDEVRGLAEHTFKEQALLKYELNRLKPSLLSQSNKLLMNDLE